MNDFDTFHGDLFPPPSPPELKRQRVESNESEHDSYEEPVPKITSRPAALPPPQPPIYVQGELYRPLEEYNKVGSKQDLKFISLQIFDGYPRRVN